MKIIIYIMAAIFSVCAFSSDGALAAKTNHEKKTCDFSTSQQPPAVQVSEGFIRIEEAKKKQDSAAIMSAVDDVWQILKAHCSNFYEANAIVWQLTQALDSAQEYEKGLELNKNAAIMTGSTVDHYKFIRRGITQAMLAGQEGEALGLIKKYLSDKKLPVELWSVDNDKQRLTYSVAKLSMPLIAGQWTLGQVISTGRRDGSSDIRYFQLGDGIYNVAKDYVTADISISYHESSEDRVPLSAVMQPITSWLFTETNDSELATQLPDFPGSYLSQTKEAYRYTDGGEQPVTAVWKITQGKWLIRIESRFLPDNRENAIKQLGELFHAIQWPQVNNLVPITPMLDELAKNSLKTPAQWHQAAVQVKPLLKAAIFPDERGIANAITGINAYHQNKLPQAWTHLQTAWTDYQYTLSTRAAESYNSQKVLNYLTDLAYRIKKSNYAELVKTSLLSSSGHSSWEIDTSTKTLISKVTGLRYPFHAGVFNAASFGYTSETIVYLSAQYAYSVEFFAGLNAQPETVQKGIFAGQVKKIRKNDLQTTPIADKDLHKSTYVVNVAGHKRTANKWQTHWYSDSDKTEKTLIFWVLPYQNTTAGIIAVVDKRDNAVLPQLDDFAKKMMMQKIK